MAEERADSLGGPLKDLTERIRLRATMFSDGQRAVADFILREYQKAAFLTAARLGRRVGVSESTVVRFAMTLGYSGYPEMQRVLQEMVRSRLTTVDRLFGSVDELGDGELVLARIMQHDMDNIRRTLQETVPEDFEEAVRLVLRARRIYVTGLRSASGTATFLAFGLNRILGNTRSLISGVENWLEQSLDLGEGDLLAAISFPRYTRRTVEIAEYAGKNGAKVLAITDGAMSPLARHADVVLCAHSSGGSFAESFVAPLSLINALLTAVAQGPKDRTAAVLDRLEKECRRYRVFWEE